MSLREWSEHGWIREVDTKVDEIKNLLGLAERNIDEGVNRTHDADWKFNILYAAIINLAESALRACGYRAGPVSSHYYLVQSFEITIGADSDTIELLDTFRKKRSIAMYEMAGIISNQDVLEIEETVVKLLADVGKWLKSKFPEEF